MVSHACVLLCTTGARSSITVAFKCNEEGKCPCVSNNFSQRALVQTHPQLMAPESLAVAESGKYMLQLNKEQAQAFAGEAGVGHTSLLKSIILT